MTVAVAGATRTSPPTLCSRFVLCLRFDALSLCRLRYGGYGCLVSVAVGGFGDGVAAAVWILSLFRIVSGVLAGQYHLVLTSFGNSYVNCNNVP